MLLFLKNLLFTILAPGMVGGYLPYWIGRQSTNLDSVDSSRLILASPQLALGATIYFWCLWHFAVTGRGTPAPIDPPKKLVVRGLYRYVRNPMYVGVLTAIAGWANLFGSVAVVEYGVAVLCAVHLFVVSVEEPQLRRRFGAEYEDYCRHVRRWVPGRAYRPAR